jgi:hypothetical protein
MIVDLNVNKDSPSSKLTTQSLAASTTTTTENTKKLDSLYHDIPSLLPFLSKRYDNDVNTLLNQPSFQLNYKQAGSGSPSFHHVSFYRLLERLIQME